MSEKLMTPDELAEYLAVSKQTIRLWCHLGKIPFLKAGHLVRFRKPDIDAWLSTQSTQKKEKKKRVLAVPLYGMLPTRTMVTLLLTFFVALFNVSDVDQVQIEQMIHPLITSVWVPLKGAQPSPQAVMPIWGIPSCPSLPWKG